MTGIVKPAPVAAIATELAAIAGDAHVCADSTSLASFAIDGIEPAASVSPGSDEEVAAVLRLANERNWIVVPAGGFTQQTIGATPERVDVILRTERLSQVMHYDPADLTLGVGAGMSMAEIDSLLAARGQMLPIDAAQPHRATIGGIMATAAHGPLRHGYGSVRDYCIGVRFVTGEGLIAKGGGRVVKNVAGYDLMKLMIGSHGTLGVIVSANFKVVPRLRQTRTFAAEFAGASEAMQFRDAVMNSPLTPMCLEIVSPMAHEFLGDAALPRHPDEHHGPPTAPHQHWTVLLRAAGSDAVLARYRRELGSAITREFDGAEETRAWRRVVDFAVMVLQRHQNAMIVQLGGAIQEVAASLSAVEKAALDNSFIAATIGRCGAGALVAAFVPLTVDPPSAMKYAAAMSSLRSGLSEGVSAQVVCCPVEAKRHFDVWGGDAVLGAMHKVRAAMDPRGVLNEGRFVV
jgi:glycolate oxidase FAD binding subunit